MEELQKHLVEALNRCIDNGMKLPFIVCAVSANGSMLSMRFNEGRDLEPLAQRLEGDVFTTPVNIMVVDHNGEAARLVIEGGKISYR